MDMKYIIFLLFGTLFVIIGRNMLPIDTFTYCQECGLFLVVMGFLLMGMCLNHALDCINNK